MTGREDDISNYTQRKHDQLQVKFVRVEEEARELRTKNLKLANEMHKAVFELDSLKAS